MATSLSSPTRRFARRGAPSLTLGIEEEVLLLDPVTGALTPLAQRALSRLGGDPRFTAELPAGQLEIRLPPATSVDAGLAALAAARRDLVDALHGLARPAAAAVHPTAPGAAPLNHGPRYDEIRAVYGQAAARQQVAALQIHVHVGAPDATIAVHDALRAHLPEIAALAANGPFYEGADTGFASVRPLLCGLLPRQGVPPVLGDEEAHARELDWGEASGTLGDRTQWWWEVRPHPVHGTLEVRVADAQTSLGQVRAVVGFVHALVAALRARLDDGGLPAPAPTWRIEQNRWDACRHGIAAVLADLGTGEAVGASARLLRLTEAIEPRPGALDATRALIRAGGGAAAQRDLAAREGLGALPLALADRFLDEAV